jgi:hypothetical protein
MYCLSSQTKPWQACCVPQQTGYNGQNRPRELSETWWLSPNSSPQPPLGATAHFWCSSYVPCITVQCTMYIRNPEFSAWRVVSIVKRLT